MSEKEDHDWAGWEEENLYFDFSILNGRLTMLHISREPPDFQPSGSALAERIEDYVGGERIDFSDVDVEFPRAGPFTLKAWEALRGIPYGETITYGELARRAGNPKASRAAGYACKTNRIAVIVPCHRVVASGGIGGFGRDIEAKRALLRLEGALD